MPPIIIATLRGGYNDTDPATALREDECADATNVEFFSSMLGERRGGTASLSLTSSGLTGETGIAHLSEWFPTNDTLAAEFIALAVTLTTSVSAARRDTAGAWHTLSPNDAIDKTAPDIFLIRTQPLDANLFIPYHSAVDRMHIWDSTAWRRAGLATPAAPTAANSATGGNFNGVRYYRVRYTVMSGAVVLRRSEPSPTLTFTPSGTKNGAVVTKPATISEGETHWELEGSLNNADFYRIATTAVGTTTYTDTTSSAKLYPAVVHAAPTSNDGTAVTYVLLSNQAAQLNLTGTISNGVYGNPAGTIAGRGWIGYDGAGTYIPAPSTWAANQNWYASPDVATALEQSSVGGTGQDYAQTGVLSEAIGAYLTLPSAKYVTVDGDRIVYGGHWTDVARASTVGWTPVKADPGVGNSERAPIVTTGGENIATTRDLDNYDGGPLTGLAASTLGTWYAFKWQRIYSAVHQSDVTNEYDIQLVNPSRGAIPGSIIRATDANGNATIFFLDPYVGPCRMGAGGVVSVIRGLRTTWKRVNLKATSVICCGLYYPYKQQVKWYLSVDGGNSPSFMITLQTSELTQMPDGTLGRGWSLGTGRAAQAQCAAALTFTVGNVTTQVPFIGQTSPEFVQQCDTGTTDNGTAFTASIKTKAFIAGGLLQRWGVMMASLLGATAASASLAVSLLRDFGLETTAVTIADFSAAGSESFVLRDLDNLDMSSARYIQLQCADPGGGQSGTWGLHRAELKTRMEESA